MTQKEQVLRHLKNEDTITPLTALGKYGIGRLAARVRELREEGHPIKTEQDDPNDFATYKLKETNQ